MDFKRFRDHFLLRIDKGEEIIGTLKEFCKKQDIPLATVSAIGASGSLTIGLFDTKTKKYITREMNGEYEITGLNGTVSRMDGEVYLHLHITITDQEFHAFGGHLNRAVVSGTCEVVINPLGGRAERKFDPATGLNLFNFGE